MKTFKDSEKRDWTISINVYSLKKVRTICGVDLMEVVEGDLLKRLSADPAMLCDVLWVLVQDDAEKRGISDEQFGRSLAGDAIDEATKAFLKELVDFFPPQKRALLTKALARLEEWEKKAIETIANRLDSPETEQKFQNLLEDAEQDFQKRLGGLSIAPRASSASTQTR